MTVILREEIGEGEFDEEVYNVEKEIYVREDCGMDVNFTWEGTCPFHDTYFYGTSTYENIVSWDWDFGDGTNGNGQDVTHQYECEDTYTVTLTITLDDESTYSISKDVEINGVGCPFEVVLQDLEVCEGDKDIPLGIDPILCNGMTNQIVARGGSRDYLFYWYPGWEVRNERSPNPELVRARQTQEFTLRVVDRQSGEEKRATMTVYVYPKARFVLPTYGYFRRGTSYNLATNLNVQISTPNMSYLWETADGWSSTEENPSVSPSERTRYYLTLQGLCPSKTSSILVIPRDRKEPTDDLNFTSVDNLMIFPNPTKDELNILANFTDKHPIEICITNTLGIEVVKINNYYSDYIDKVLDLNSLPMGVYFLQIKIGEDVYTEKIIKE
jgi:hypothetical protein